MQTSMEKRQQFRIYGLFPVFLNIDEKCGEKHKVHALADNVSSGGLYLHLPYALDTGTKLFALIGLPSGAKLAGLGQVLRVEQKDQTLFGMAISIDRNRLISDFAV
jgi:hypothetical protein